MRRAQWFVIVSYLPLSLTLAGDDHLALRISQATLAEGAAPWDWFHARTAWLPSDRPMAVTTMSLTGNIGAHDYYDIYQTISRDGGVTWSSPRIIPSLKRIRQPDDYQVSIGDLWPTWHSRTKTVLLTGVTFHFAPDGRQDRARERVPYAVMRPQSGVWGPIRFLQLPHRDAQNRIMTEPSAGCTQRVDLPDGDVLLPIRLRLLPDTDSTQTDPFDSAHRLYTSIVLRCGFDGETLIYKEHGSEHSISLQHSHRLAKRRKAAPSARGLYEPSLAQFDGKFYLTLRSDHSAFVTRGTDGIHFEPAREWTFDDGQLLGSYNTQQHWVTVGGGLFLIYTRSGADNDHIGRHRAPLFIGQVDPHRLQIRRATERVLIPENHAMLGNSGVCWISDRESWVTCAERLEGGKRHLENNRVLLVKIVAP